MEGQVQQRQQWQQQRTLPTLPTLLGSSGKHEEPLLAPSPSWRMKRSPSAPARGFSKDGTEGNAAAGMPDSLKDNLERLVAAVQQVQRSWGVSAEEQRAPPAHPQCSPGVQRCTPEGPRVAVAAPPPSGAVVQQPPSAQPLHTVPAQSSPPVPQSPWRMSRLVSFSSLARVSAPPVQVVGHPSAAGPPVGFQPSPHTPRISGGSVTLQAGLQAASHMVPPGRR